MATDTSLTVALHLTVPRPKQNCTLAHLRRTILRHAKYALTFSHNFFHEDWRINNSGVVMRSMPTRMSRNVYVNRASCRVAAKRPPIPVTWTSLLYYCGTCHAHLLGSLKTSRHGGFVHLTNQSTLIDHIRTHSRDMLQLIQ